MHRALFVSVVLFHLAIVPLVVFATNQVLGSWTPIVTAQGCLLSLYLGFGSGPLWRRTLLFAIGCSFLVLLRLVGQWLLLNPNPWPAWGALAFKLSRDSLGIVMPTCVSALVMLMMRPWIGELRRPDATTSHVQFSLSDLLLITTLVSVATAWYTYVANLPLGGSSSKRVADIVPIVPQLCWGLRRTIGTISLTWMTFSKRAWWAGITPIIALQTFELSRISERSFWLSMYCWAVVFVTLLVFRLAGYRLERTLTGQRQVDQKAHHLATASI